jgi:hypothetical protein
VAFGARGSRCTAGATVSVADLGNRSESNKAVVSVISAPAGPAVSGVLSDLSFDGSQLVAGWSSFADSEPCTSLGMPSLWRTPIPASGTGSPASPSPAAWEERTAGRGFERTTSSGEALYTAPATDAGVTSQDDLMQLWFGPGPGGAGPVKLADFVVEVVARPL